MSGKSTGGTFVDNQSATASNPGRRRRSDDVFKAVGGVAGQPHAFTAAAQVLTVGPLHVDVPLLLLADAASLRATLQNTKDPIRRKPSSYTPDVFSYQPMYLAED